jgi:lincosamide nucleotidyltransferase
MAGKAGNTMKHTEALLKRLDDIGASLAQTGQALALIGLGSVGTELDRLDDYSDLDFFAIVKAGQKVHFINNLDWLSNIQPIAFAFQNTHDGYKLLYADGIFCEMAVFEPEELAQIPFAQGRIVWRDAAFDEALAIPKSHTPNSKNPDWLIGEAVTNLYVGLGRYHRGEKLSAARFIQGYAVDRVLDLAGTIEAEGSAHKDLFMTERRFEFRFPGVAAALPDFIQGYDRSRESARAILQFLDQHFEINPAMKQAILDLCS